MTTDNKPRNIEQAASELNVSQATIRAWISQRRIGHTKLGRSVRIPVSEILRLLEAGYIPPAPQHLEK